MRRRDDLQPEHVHVHPDRRLIAFRAVVALAAVVLAASLWTWGLPLSNDGPAHVLGAWVHLHPERYAGIWEPHTPITSNGFHQMQQLLALLLGWRDAWRINVILIAEAWAFGYVAFVAALAPQRRWLGLLGFPFALHPNLYMGFYAFTAASACAWWTLAYWLRAERARTSAREHVALGLLMLLMAFVHVVAAALCGLVLVAVTLARTAPPSLPLGKRLAALVAAGTPAGIVAWLASATDAGARVEPVEGNVVERLWNVGASFPGGPSWRIGLAFAVAAFGIVGTVHRARSMRSTTTTTATTTTTTTTTTPALRIEQALALCAIALLCASWAAPRDFAGWQYAGGRFAPLGMGLLCALAPMGAALQPDDAMTRMHRALRTAAALFTFVFCLATLAWSFALHASMREHNAPALRALDVVAANAPGASSWTMIALDPRDSDQLMLGHQPFFHLHHVFAVELGGFATQAHDRAPTVHHLRLARRIEGEPVAMVRDDADAERHALALRRQLSYAAAHGALVLAGTQADHDTAIAAGFVPMARERALDANDTNNVLVAGFEGCTGKARLEGMTAPVAFDVGWWPRRSPVVTVHVPLPNDGSSTVDVPLPPLACGDVWLAPAGARCTGAAVGAPMRATFSRGADNVIVCALGAAGTQESHVP